MYFKYIHILGENKMNKKETAEIKKNFSDKSGFEGQQSGFGTFGRGIEILSNAAYFLLVCWCWQCHFQAD